MPKTIRQSEKYKGARGKQAQGRKKNPTVDGSKIKSAAELGFKAESLGIGKRVAKSHKGRKIMEAKQAQVIEGPKKGIFIKGNKTSQNVMDLMKDLSILRGPEMSKLFMRKGYEVHPFEDIGLVEQMASKQSCTLFCVGTQQKKRPENVIFGRIFAEHLLDMFEFGVSNYRGINAFKTQEVGNQIMPVLSFQGEHFDFNDKFKRFKNYLIDFFKISNYEEVNISELKRVMVFTATGDDTINCRSFEILRSFTETTIHSKDLALNEIGPTFDLTMRRDKLAAPELYKAACRQPKTENPEKKKFRKNMYTDEWGQQKGKVFLQHQDINMLSTRKWKHQKPNKAELVNPVPDKEDL